MSLISKKCCTCKIEKYLHNFNKCKSSEDGLHWRCRDCTKKSEKRGRHKNLQKASRARAWKRYAAKPEVRAHRQELRQKRVYNRVYIQV